MENVNSLLRKSVAQDPAKIAAAFGRRLLRWLGPGDADPVMDILILCESMLLENLLRLRTEKPAKPLDIARFARAIGQTTRTIRTIHQSLAASAPHTGTGRRPPDLEKILAREARRCAAGGRSPTNT